MVLNKLWENRRSRFRTAARPFLLICCWASEEVPGSVYTLGEMWEGQRSQEQSFLPPPGIKGESIDPQTLPGGPTISVILPRVALGSPLVIGSRLKEPHCLAVTPATASSPGRSVADWWSLRRGLVMEAKTVLRCTFLCKSSTTGF